MGTEQLRPFTQPSVGPDSRTRTRLSEGQALSGLVARYEKDARVMFLSPPTKVTGDESSLLICKCRTILASQG